MNSIQSLIDRQLGLNCRFNYDSILKRLVVDEEESFYGLQGAGQGAGPVLEADPPIFACRFAECAGYEHILALANEDGRVAIQNTFSQRTASVIESFQCHNNAVFDLVWMPGTMNFVTVSGDHTACLWQLSAGAARRVQTFAGHSRSVKAACGAPGGAVFATGARDGHVLVWDTRAPLANTAPALALRPDNRLAACHACSRPRTPHAHGKRARTEPRAVSVTGLAFQDERTLLSCGECDGNIKAWDLRKNYSAHTRDPLPRSAIPYAGSSARNGYSNLLLDAARVRLYASCMDHVVYCFNVATYSAVPERRYLGHENSTFYIKTSLSPDGRYLVSGSTDKSAYIWSVERPEPLARLAGHRAEVTCAAWCQRGDPKLVTCSDDARHKIWRIGPEEARAHPRLEGRAEEAPRAEGGARPQWGARERTPHAPRRRAAADPPAAAPARRRSKRCLADLMGAAAAAGEEADEERLLPAGVKRRLSSTSPVRGAQEAEWAGAHVTPPHTPERSPARVRVLAFGTPTRDLPDFVSSGEAPHLRLMSPARKRPGRPDWLTELRREKRPRREDAGDDSERDAAPAPAPAPTATATAKESAPARRTSVSDRTPRANRSAWTLLKYFNVTTKK